MTRGWQLPLVFALSLVFLCSLIAWLQNVHIITNNGMYKAIQGEPWIADPGGARLDPSNYLYFPLYALLCRLLDALGIARGIPWKQFAYLNAFFASVGVAFVYAFVHRLTRSTLAAAFAAVFHLGSGFVLLLAVINEDIMPGYVLVLGSMLLAGLWFDRPTYTRVCLVGALFTLGETASGGAMIGTFSDRLGQIRPVAGSSLYALVRRRRPSLSLSLVTWPMAMALVRNNGLGWMACQTFEVVSPNAASTTLLERRICCAQYSSELNVLPEAKLMSVSGLGGCNSAKRMSKPTTLTPWALSSRTSLA